MGVPPAATVPEPPEAVLALALGTVRAVIGIGGYLAPSLVATPWVGRRAARSRAVRLFGRTLAARDLALGAGALGAADDRDALARWTAAGALADAADFVTTLLAYRSLPRYLRGLILVFTGAAAVLGAAAASSLSDHHRDSRATR